MKYNYLIEHNFDPKNKLQYITISIKDKNFVQINSFLMLGSIIYKFDEIIENTKKVLSGELDKFEVLPDDNDSSSGPLFITKDFVWLEDFEDIFLETEDFLELIQMTITEMKKNNLYKEKMLMLKELKEFDWYIEGYLKSKKQN